MDLMQMSLSGACMIIVAVVIRALGINRLPKRVFLLMWAVVLLRLMLPFSICVFLGAEVPISQGVPEQGPATGLLEERYFTPVVLEGAVPAMMDIAGGRIVPVLKIIWAVGVTVCGLFFLAAYIKNYRRFRVSVPVDNEFTRSWLRERPYFRPVSIRQGPYIDAPLSYGVFRPVILVPDNTDWTDLKTLRYVFTHEYIHIRRWDVVAKLVLTIAFCVHWFNPVVWVMYFLANRDLELSCDEAVIHKFGLQAARDYALTLLNVEERRNFFQPFTNNFNKNFMEERIEAIMKIKRTSVIATVLALVVFSVSVTAFAVSAEPFPEEETTMISLDAARREGNLFVVDESAAAADELTRISLEEAQAEGVRFAGDSAADTERAAINPGDPGIMPLASGELAAESGMLFDTLSIGAGKYLTISINYTPTTGSMRIGFMNTSTGNISYSTVYNGSGTKPFYIGATGTYQLYVYNPSSYDVDFSLSYIVT